MITINDIQNIPYISADPAPDSGQTRIGYILDGDKVDGADSETGTEGDLNKPSVQIQANVEVLSQNTISQQSTIEELVDSVNTLTGFDGADLGTRLTEVEQDFENRTQQIIENSNSIGVPSSGGVNATGLHLSVEQLDSRIGQRNPLDVLNPSLTDDSVRADTWYIKSVLIGNKELYDPNGTYDPSYTTATGITGE